MIGGAGTSVDYGSAITNFQMNVDGLLYTTAGFSAATVRDNHMAGSSAPLRDTFIIANFSPAGPMVSGLNPARIQFALGGTDTSILSNTAAPSVAQFFAMLAADTIGGNLNFLSFDDGSDARFSVNSMTINGVGPSTVPLPAGLPLILAGLGAFGLVKRRQTS